MILTCGLYVNGEVTFCLDTFLGKVRFSFVSVFPSPKGKGWVHPISYLRRVEGQQSGASLHAWQHLLVITAADQNFLGAWEWNRQRQKKVRAGDGTCLRVCPWHEQPQDAKGSVQGWSWLRGDSEGSHPLLFCSVQRAGNSVVVLGPVFCVQGMRKGPQRRQVVKLPCMVLTDVSCEHAVCYQEGPHSWLLTKKYWIICWTSITAN